MPREFMLEVFPQLQGTTHANPETYFDLYIDSHADHRQVRAVYYNQRSRNEVRITRLGGMNSALLDPESTGALVVFSFGPSGLEMRSPCHVWVCDSVLEEDVILNTIGWVEAGIFRLSNFQDNQIFVAQPDGSSLRKESLPIEWFNRFPTTDELVDKVIELCPPNALDADERLIRRRECEYELFQIVEELVSLPTVKQGFATMNNFIMFAQTTIQRRRVRSGRSLELHVRRILQEEGLQEDRDFAYRTETEEGKCPNFLFPSKAHYDDTNFPSDLLRMLAVSNTCRDRWSQIISQADRIPIKNLLTLQEGMSIGLFDQMKSAGIHLVVPTGLVAYYPSKVRSELTTFESFIGDMRLLQSKVKL